jgi:hypothetical protein
MQPRKSKKDQVFQPMLFFSSMGAVAFIAYLKNPDLCSCRYTHEWSIHLTSHKKLLHHNRDWPNSGLTGPLRSKGHYVESPLWQFKPVFKRL